MKMFFSSSQTQMIRRCFALAALSLCFAAVAWAQEDRTTQQQLPAPPPLKSISPEDRALLSAAHDIKARVKVSIELANTHLLRAEEFTSRDQYDAASAELGRYRGIVEDGLRYLIQVNTSNRDLYRRLELSLRTHSLRIEAIRRATPAEYAVNVKAIGEHTRKARTDALNAFYGDTVVRERYEEEQPARGNESTQAPKPETRKP